MTLPFATLPWCTLVVLAGCTTLPASQPAPAAPPAMPVAAVLPRPAAAPAAMKPTPPATTATPTVPTPPPGTPPPFATVIKDARKTEGPLTVWQKDDKLWIELAPAQLGQPFLLSPKFKTGLGEGNLLGGLQAFPVSGAGGAQVVEFVRVHNTVRLQARNLDVVVKPGTPQARAVATAYSASLMGATPVASQPHPDSKAILIEANGLFLSDLAGTSMHLQRTFRQGYSLDRSNSSITTVRATPGLLVVETQNHYYTGGISTGGPAMLPGAVASSVPRWLPDTRSLFIGHHYSLVPLPAQPMATRRADARIGHFASTVLDFNDDSAHTPRKRMLHRWRLDKKDPAAELSEPVKPITFWIDRNVPLAYRDTVRSAILEWNKAFERIGFRDAIVVQQQPDDAAFDTLDFGIASVRWMVNADNWFSAIGQSQVDPRTGEILDADVAFESMSLRAQRYARSQVLAAARAREATPAVLPFAAPPNLPWDTASGATDEAAAHAFCRHGDVAAEQFSYAMDVMEARGELDPDDARAQQFVLDYVKDTVMHEIGHALGLRHNFRASRAYSEAQLSDPEFTRANGTTGSVMEYNAVNLPRPGETGGVPFQLTLGPYDYWAIEYAYKPLPPGTSAVAEEAELQRIAARSSEPLLGFGTDEDAAAGVDPETLQLDLGADPLAFAAKRLDIARDLFRRQEVRVLPPERDYAVLRRSLGFALGDAARAVGVLARQLGGLRTLRDHPGSGRDPLAPVPAAVQRQSYELISRGVLSAQALAVTPQLQRRLAPDFLERGESGAALDFQLPQQLAGLQRGVLGYLLSDFLAARFLDGQAKLDAGAQAFPLSELYARLAKDVWSELDAAAPITAPRRELQRDYVNRVASALLRPSPAARADARAPLRSQAERLLARIERALQVRKSRLDSDSRGHLRDSADTLRQALSAKLPRVAV